MTSGNRVIWQQRVSHNNEIAKRSTSPITTIGRLPTRNNECYPAGKAIGAATR